MQTATWGERARPWLFGSLLFAILAPAVVLLPPIHQMALVASVVVGLAFVTRPEVSLAIVLTVRILVDLLWWAPGEVFGMNVMELYSGTVAGLAALLVMLHVDRVQRNPWFAFFLPFLIIMVIAGLRAGDARTGAEIAARFLSPPLLMFLVAGLLSEDLRQKLIFAVPIVAIVPVVVGFWCWAHGQMHEEMLHGYARLRGAYANIHNHAHAMAFFASLGIFHMRRSEKKWETALWVAFTGACCVLMYLTYVRTALLGLLVFGLLFLAFERMYKVLLVAFVALCFAFTTSAVLQDRFSDITKIVDNDGEEGEDEGKLGSGRIHIWTGALKGYLDEPSIDLVVGAGLNRQHDFNEHHLDSHNDYLALLIQMGPVGLFTYLAFQAMLVWRARALAKVARNRFEHAFASWAVGISAMVLVTNALSNSYINRIHVAWLFWGLSGVLFGLADDAEAEAERGLPPGRRPGVDAEARAYPFLTSLAKPRAIPVTSPAHAPPADGIGPRPTRTA